MKQKSSKPEKTSASALPLAMPLILPVVTLLLCAAIVLVFMMLYRKQDNVLDPEVVAEEA